MKSPSASTVGALVGLGGGTLAQYFAVFNSGTSEVFFNAIMNVPEYLRGSPAIAGLFVITGALIPTGGILGSYIGRGGSYIGRRLSNRSRNLHGNENSWGTIEPYDFRRG